MRRDVGRVVRLVGTDVDGAVLDAVGVVHIGGGQGYACAHVGGSGVQTLVAAQSAVLIEAVVVGEAGVAVEETAAA